MCPRRRASALKAGWAGQPRCPASRTWKTDHLVNVCGKSPNRSRIVKVVTGSDGHLKQNLTVKSKAVAALPKPSTT